MAVYLDPRARLKAIEPDLEVDEEARSLGMVGDAEDSHFQEAMPDREFTDRGEDGTITNETPGSRNKKATREIEKHSHMAMEEAQAIPYRRRNTLRITLVMKEVRRWLHLLVPTKVAAQSSLLTRLEHSLHGSRRGRSMHRVRWASRIRCCEISQTVHTGGPEGCRGQVYCSKGI